jgi:hypothetical protein
MTNNTALSLLQARDYLRLQRRAGFITHWEIETSDSTRGMFQVRVSLARPGVSVFEAEVSPFFRGRDLLSAAHRAVAWVSK